MLKYILQEMKVGDQKFMYNLLEEYVKTNLSVTVLTLKPFNEYFKIYNSNNLKTYIVIIKEENAGFVHITKEGEIGYYLGKKYEGKGIASRAVKEMLHLNPMERYYSVVNIKNIRSSELVEGLGFLPKGITYEKISNN